MIIKTFRIKNQQGLHMRPAREFVQAMTKFSADTTIEYNGNKYNAKSIMNVMAACIKYNSEINIICDGTDEQAAMAKAQELIEAGFGEL